MLYSVRALELKKNFLFPPAVRLARKRALEEASDSRKQQRTAPVIAPTTAAPAVSAAPTAPSANAWQQYYQQYSQYPYYGATAAVPK